MRWMLHGQITEAAAEALVRHGHSAERLAGLPADAPAAEVLEAASARQLDLLTSDAAVVEAIYAKPGAARGRFARALVYLQLEAGEVEQDEAIDRLFERYKRLTPGRMYTLTAARVKVRQLPGLK